MYSWWNKAWKKTWSAHLFYSILVRYNNITQSNQSTYSYYLEITKMLKMFKYACQYSLKILKTWFYNVYVFLISKYAFINMKQINLFRFLVFWIVDKLTYHVVIY